MRKVEVVAYDETWPGSFDTEADEIRNLLGNHCMAIHHIGSTAVRGLAAKPVIDMLAVVDEIEAAERSAKELQQLGYKEKGENGLPGRRYFEKGGNERTHHLHCYEKGSPEISRHLAFRDFLREHPQQAAAYGDLKLSLAAQYPLDIGRYIDGKQAMVQRIEKQATGEI